MKLHQPIIIRSMCLIIGVGLMGTVRVVTAAPAFAIAATNVTMPASGNGSSTYTVTGIPTTGILIVGCKYSGPVTTARIPICTYGPIVAIPVNGGQTVTGAISFYPFGSIVPLAMRAEGQKGLAPALGLALGGGVVLGLGIRRRTRRWLVLTVCVFGALAGLAGLSGCIAGFGGMNMTPGAYQYTVAALFQETGSNVLQTANTTIQVTVP